MCLSHWTAIALSGRYDIICPSDCNGLEITSDVSTGLFNDSEACKLLTIATEVCDMSLGFSLKIIN